MTETEAIRENYNLGVLAGEARERQRIRANILSRIADLNACGKTDNCAEFAELIDGYISEWIEEEQK